MQTNLLNDALFSGDFPARKSETDSILRISFTLLSFHLDHCTSSLLLLLLLQLLFFQVVTYTL